MPSLRTKIVLLAATLSVAIPGVFFIVLNTREAQSNQKARILAANRQEAQLALWRVQDHLEVPLEDARILSRTPPIRGLQRTHSLGVDLVEGSSERQWKDRLAEIFTAMLETRPEYDQIRLIAFEPEGRELVRVDQNDGAPARAESDALQNKSGEPYYTLAESLPPMQPALTPITFNREHGRRDPRGVRTMRVVSTAHFPDGRPFGFVVINVDFGKFLLRALQRIAPSRNVMIFNLAGDYAIHREGLNDPAFHAGHSATGPETPPEYALGERLLDDGGFTVGDAFYALVTAQTMTDAPDPSLRALAWSDGTELAPFNERSWIDMALIGVALCLGVAATTAVGAGRMTRHLRQMTREIQKYDGAPGSLDLPTGSRDEIGALARAFQDLLTRQRETERKARAVIDDLMEAVVVADDGGIIEEFSRTAERMFGITAREAIGHPVGILIPEAERDGHQRAVHLRRSGKKDGWMVGNQRSVTARRGDGTPFPAEVSVSEIPLGDRLLLSAVIRDTTDRQLRRRASEFISTVSHELRTPLTSILASLGMLERLSGDKLDPRSRRLLALARSGGERLTRIVDDILDLEKIQNGKIVFNTQELDLRDQVAQCVEHHRAAAMEKGRELALKLSAAPCPVRIDPMRFDQALGNLLSNALRYEPVGGAVQVTVSRSGDGRVEVAVRDHGPGVPEHFRDKLFERFTQAEGSGGGSGLGLNISRSLLRAFGGDLTFQSQEGAGAVFFIELPLRTGAQAGDASHAVEA